MIAHVLVYIFLAIALGAMVYVVGMPWLKPKPQEGFDNLTFADRRNLVSTFTPPHYSTQRTH